MTPFTDCSYDKSIIHCSEQGVIGMDVIAGMLGLLLVLGLLVGAVLGWVSALSLGKLRLRLATVERDLARLRPAPSEDAAPGHGVNADSETPGLVESAPGRGAVTADGTRVAAVGSGAGWSAGGSREGTGGRAAGNPFSGTVGRFLAGVRDNWMLWFGAFCVALAGIFLVRFSIEQGYLGPTGRVLVAAATGLALHGIAEWLRRRLQRRYDAVAALAGSASLVLYAAFVAALHLYQLWPPLVIFTLLALVSLGTMVLALRHGPVLAVLGILGAFAVPALLGGDATDLLPVLAYSLIVFAAAFVLMRYVYRHWLWWGTLAGALFWWLVALHAGAQTEAWLGTYLAVLAWCMLALRGRNYSLTRVVPESRGDGPWWRSFRFSGSEEGPERMGLLVLLVAQAYSMALDPQWSFGPWIWLPLAAVILLASRFDGTLRALPWMTLAAISAGLAGSVLNWRLTAPQVWSVVPIDSANQATVLMTLVLMTLLFAAAGFWQLWVRRDSAWAASLAFIAPLTFLALAHWLLPDALPRWGLSAMALIVGMALGGFAGKRLRAGIADSIAFWQIAAGHLAYSLAVVISFADATLTLALAVQVLSLTWLTRRFEVRHLDWLVKLALVVVLVRLTLNPWLLEYGADSNWTLWTYGGSLILVWAAGFLTRDGEPLKLWLRAGSLHLLILFLHTQIRYALYDGDVFAARYDFLEVSLNTSLWAALALLYYWRSRLGLGLDGFYRGVAQILMLLAVGSYLMLLTAMNPFWDPASAGAITSTPILNLLLLAYGLPVVFWGLASRYHEPDLRPFFVLLTGVGLWLFVSFEIRHLWQGRLDLSDAFRDGELYTYSVVWLAMAVGIMLAGTWRGASAVYRGGLVLLALVIAKIFFVDMAGLTGLLRALSFLGLGLSLLGLAFVHQYLGRKLRDSAVEDEPQGV
jgi:uncharacterized membrane protein